MTWTSTVAGGTSARPVPGRRVPPDRRRRAVAAGALAAWLLTACGGAPDEGAASGPVPTASPSAPGPEASAEATGATPTVAATTTGASTPTAGAGAGVGSPSAAPTADEPAQPAVPVDEDDGSAAGAQGLDAAPTGSTGPVQAPPSGGQVLFTAVRVAAQDGFDRVVFEYEGDGVPGYRFSYQATASQQATGDVIDLPGETGLRGIIRSVDWTSDENYVFPKRVSAAGTRSVTVVDVGVLFEADQDPYIGVTEEKPFRVTLLEDPTRIVVDVAH